MAVWVWTMAGRSFILADTLGNSVFDPGELSRELEVILEEVRMNEDDPGRVVSKALFREAYKVHPYGRPVIGTVDTIRKTTREDLLAYFHANYVPGNMVLVIAGAVDPKTSRPLIERTFGQLPPGSASNAAIPAEPPQRETRVVVTEKDARRAYLEMSFHGPSMKDPDVYAWDLLSMILQVMVGLPPLLGPQPAALFIPLLGLGGELSDKFLPGVGVEKDPA